jgi:uncharacterized protein (DUF362 family)
MPTDDTPTRRREMMIQLLRAGGLGAAATGVGFWLHGRSRKPEQAAVEAARVRAPIPDDPAFAQMSIVTGGEAGAAARRAVDELGGIRRFVARGDVVVVKPNAGWDRTPEFAATTNPEVVAALVRLSLEAGAKRVKILDYPVNDARRCYRQSGILDAATAAGAEVVYPDSRKFRDMKIGGGTIKSWPMYTEVVEADRIINVPIAKTHGTSTLTLGMKNWMGVMGGWRGRIHQRIHESLVDVSLFLKPSLVVLDAVRILTDNGPQGGDLADVKRLDTVIAGADQVAVDAYGATLFGIKGADIGFIRLGHEAGLGTMDLARLRMKKVQA